MLLNDTLHSLSESSMQELLHIDLVQQILSHSNKTTKSLTIALNALSGTSTNKVRLQPKSDDDLKAILESIEKLASTLDSSKHPQTVIQAAKSVASTSSVDNLIEFAKLYYRSCLHSCLAGLIRKG